MWLVYCSECGPVHIGSIKRDAFRLAHKHPHPAFCGKVEAPRQPQVYFREDEDMVGTTIGLAIRDLASPILRSLTSPSNVVLHEEMMSSYVFNTPYSTSRLRDLEEEMEARYGSLGPISLTSTYKPESDVIHVVVTQRRQQVMGGGRHG